MYVGIHVFLFEYFRCAELLFPCLCSPYFIYIFINYETHDIEVILINKVMTKEYNVTNALIFLDFGYVSYIMLIVYSNFGTK